MVATFATEVNVSTNQKWRYESWVPTEQVVAKKTLSILQLQKTMPKLFAEHAIH